MIYNTLTYMPLFLGLAVLLYYLVPKRLRPFLLLAANLVFYLPAGLYSLFFMAATAASTFLGGLWLERLKQKSQEARKGLSHEEAHAVKASFLRRQRRATALSLFLPFACLVFLKYYTFVSDNANVLLGFFGEARLPALSLFLPLGISFYTLQAASYVFDVYRGKYAAERNPARYLLYVSFFATVVEGPIARYDQLAAQLWEGHAFDKRRAAQGCRRILWGLLKKIVLADRANMLVNTVFMPDVSYSAAVTCIGILAYTLQIYAEFSGCMDIVCGSAQLFGVALPENFQRPYFSRSAAEFWRRWHRTLGAWLKDYIFYPLSSSRPLLALTRRLSRTNRCLLKKLLPSACALFFVWLANGLWHGPSWRYIFYGMYYYGVMMAGLFLEPFFARCFKRLPLDRHGRVMDGFRWLRTFCIVNVGMMIFRAASLKTALRMFLTLFTGGWLAPLTDGSLLSLSLDSKDYAVLIAGSLILFTAEAVEEKGVPLWERLASQPAAVRWGVSYAMFLSLVLFGAYGSHYDPAAFIYAAF